MKAILTLTLISTLSLANCGLIPGGFSYSTAVTHSYTPVVQTPEAIYPNYQPLYSQQILQSPLYTPVLSNPIYNHPVVAQPIYGGYPVYPIQGTPIQGTPIQGTPIQGGYPVSPIGVPGAPGGAPGQQDLSPQPAPGNIVDEDTVSVESA